MFFPKAASAFLTVSTLLFSSPALAGNEIRNWLGVLNEITAISCDDMSKDKLRYAKVSPFASCRTKTMGFMIPSMANKCIHNIVDASKDECWKLIDILITEPFYDRVTIEVKEWSDKQ